MNLGAFDLNLLVVFDAVMQERSVTRAGQRIGLSQPAMSHALARLRHMLKDELFVRTTEGMAPTPRAEALAIPLRNALSEMQAALAPADFDPATSNRRFAVAVNNYAAVVLVPPLVAAVAAAAPGIGLDLRPSGTLNLVEQLDRGDLDLALGSFAAARDRFLTAALFQDPFVMVMRQGHSAGSGDLPPATFAELPFIEISSSREDLSFLDRWLAEHGQTRRIALRAPYLSAVPLLTRSDMVCILSLRIARELVRSHPLQLRELPAASPHIKTGMLWHRRLDGQSSQRWLRDIVLTVAKDL
jgi:DNA-binding transcriptional LysR family regulator